VVYSHERVAEVEASSSAWMSPQEKADVRDDVIRELEERGQLGLRAKEGRLHPHRRLGHQLKVAIASSARRADHEEWTEIKKL
jgi:hypothetical protein